MKRHYRAINSAGAKVVLQVIESWRKSSECDDNASLIEYTNDWVNRTNRGGLFLVKDNFYRFILRIEVTARKVLNSAFLCQYAGQDIRRVIMEKLDADKCLTVGWNTLLRSINNSNVSDTLKKAVFSKWISIRANAFVRAWVDQVKLKQQLNKEKDGTTQKIDTVAQPSLRKSLAS